MAAKKILVTGGTGFIGGHLVKRLSKEGYQVKILSRQGSPDIFVSNSNVSVEIGDVTDQASVDNAVKGVDVVFHLAAALNSHGVTKEQMGNINIDGAKNVLESCRKNGVQRVVHVSSVGVIGSTSPEGEDESAPTRPVSDYEKSKLEGEKLALNYYREHDLPVVVVRPSLVYGPGDVRSGIFNLFMAISKRRFLTIGNKDIMFHTLFIDNLVDALFLAMTKKEALGEIFNIADASALSLTKLAKKIAHAEDVKILPGYLPFWLAKLAALGFDLLKILGLSVPIDSIRLWFMTHHRSYDVSKSRKLLGYNPRVDLNKGISDTVDWYRQMGYL